MWIHDGQTFLLQVDTGLSNICTQSQYMTAKQLYSMWIFILYYIVVFVLLSGYMTVEHLYYKWIQDCQNLYSKSIHDWQTVILHVNIYIIL